MHILLALLGSIVSIMVLLNRLADAGIDLRGLNPFLGKRRRQWKKMYEGNPIFKINDPMEVTAMLLLAVARVGGDISSEEKRKIRELYEKEFNLSKRDAAGLMISSAYILQDGTELKSNLNKIIAPSLGRYTQSQVESTLSMLRTIASLDGDMNEMQKEFIDSIQTEFSSKFAPEAQW